MTENYIVEEISIDADPVSVWEVLVDTEFTKDWASSFSPGTWVEADWEPGTEVKWWDKDGNLGARGKVLVNDSFRNIRIGFYESITADTSDLGDYTENYSIEEKHDHTLLRIEAGPLATKDLEEMWPLWKNAIKKMKHLAEGIAGEDKLDFF